MGEWCLAYRTSVDVCVHITSWRDRLRERVIVGGPGACTCIRTRLEPVIRDPGDRWGSGRLDSFSPYTTIHRAVGGRTDTVYRSLLQYHCDYPLRRTFPVAGARAVVRYRDATFGRADRLALSYCWPCSSNLGYPSRPWVHARSTSVGRPGLTPSTPPPFRSFWSHDRRFCLFPRICPCQTSAMAFRVRICAGCFGLILGP